MTSAFNWKGQPSTFSGPEFNGSRDKLSKSATKAVERGAVTGTIHGLSPNADKRLANLGVRRRLLKEKK